MSGAIDLSIDQLYAIEEALDWAAGEARASADVCTFFEATTLLSRAEDLDNLCATVQGVLRVRQVAEQAFHVDFDDEGESTC